MNITICYHCSIIAEKGPIITCINKQSAAIFGKIESTAVMGVKAPSYTSGVYIWKEQLNS